MDLAGKTCTTQGFSKGTLACSTSCKLETSGCSTCGNGTKESGEDCDGQDLGAATCATEAGAQHGVLTCKTDCTFDEAQCHTCGDGPVEGPLETCEPDDFGGATCVTKGFAYGDLACPIPACTVDDGACRAFCGNGVIEGEEQCDRDALPSTTRADLNPLFPGGEVTCSAACLLSTAHCHRCGNNTKDPEEECDGSDFGGASCVTLGGAGTTGSLDCSQSCKIDASDCTLPVNTCGDGLVQTGEQCDGVNLGGKTCKDLHEYGGGHLSCAANCLFDTSACEPVPCGNGKLEGGVGEYGELCDGTNLAGESCASPGFAGGTLACTPWCTFDLKSCQGKTTCGNGKVEPGEDCDTVPPAGLTCQALGFLPGGNVQCAANCTLDTSSCKRCGDGKLDWDEECDAAQLRGLECSDFGFFGGTLACKSNRTFQTSGCNGCGNGVIATGEECDGDDFGGATCASLDPSRPQGDLGCNVSTCEIDASDCHDCGNGTIEGPETCDPLPSGTCESNGFDGGMMVCTPDCMGVDTSGCWKAGDGECNTLAGETLANSAADCGWKQIEAGNGWTCSVRNDGSVYCWGAGYSATPSRLVLPHKAVQVSVGTGHACAVLDDARVWCWGSNTYGELGDGTNDAPSGPVQAKSLASVGPCWRSGSARVRGRPTAPYGAGAGTVSACWATVLDRPTATHPRWCPEREAWRSSPSEPTALGAT